MRCKTAERLISLKLDNELSAHQAQALQEHLQECSSCARILAANQDLQAQLQVTSLPEYPEWLHYRILSNLPRENRRSWVRKPGLSYATASLAILLSLFAGTLVGIKGYEGSQLHPQIEESETYISFGEHSLLEVFDE
jgi:predicted anti-sigma-YlaC factor YlaD